MSQTFLGLSINLKEGIETFLTQYKNTIEIIMKNCGLSYMMILGPRIGMPHLTEQLLIFNESGPTIPTKEKEAEIRGSYIFIFEKVNSDLTGSVLSQNISCFYSKFQEALGVQDYNIWNSNVSIIAINFSQPDRNIILDIKLQIEPTSQPEPSNVPVDKGDCSIHIEKIKKLNLQLEKLQIKFDNLNTEKILKDRELDDCKKNKEILDTDLGSILIKLDLLHLFSFKTPIFI